MTFRRWLLFLLALFLLMGCSRAADVVEQVPTVAPMVEASVTVVEDDVVPTSTPLPTATSEPTHTVLVASATSTPTQTPWPTPTAVPVALLTPAPHAPDLPQPAYVASACSDRFPCNDDVAAWEARIQVPEGFTVSYFAYLPSPDYEGRGQQITSMTFGPDGLLYVSTGRGDIYTLDAAGTPSLYVEGLTVPTGIAFLPGSNRLYVSNRVEDRNVDGEGQISVIENGQIKTLFDGIPCCYIGMHGPNGIAFDEEGYGYVGVGGRADHGEILDGSNRPDELHSWEAAILRFRPDGEEISVYARGFRNPYDITWDAQGRLWAGDNGRDGNAADGDIAAEELHIVEPGGEHGYPYYECPACFGIPPGVEIVPPFEEFEAHSVPVGITTYMAEQFPGYYNSVFLTLWTALPFAQRIVRVTADGVVSTFATGFAAPMDVTVGPDGSLYVGDYATGIIFKISYTNS